MGLDTEHYACLHFHLCLRCPAQLKSDSPDWQWRRSFMHSDRHRRRKGITSNTIVIQCVVSSYDPTLYQAQCQFQWVQVLEILLEKKPREGTCALLCPPLGAPSAAPCAAMSISDRLGPRMRSSFDLSPTLEPVAAALYRCVAPHPHCALNTLLTASRPTWSPVRII